MSERKRARSYTWYAPGLSKWDPLRPRQAGVVDGRVVGDASWDEVVAELLRVVRERDEASRRAELAEAALADAVKEAAYHAARAYDGETLADRNAYIGEDLTEQRDALGKALREIRFQAARSIAGSGPRTAERRLAEFVQERALAALCAAGLLEEDS